MSSDSSLLKPFKLNDALQTRNRVVLAPLTRARAGKNRVPTDAMVEYYRQRASAGLIISEATVVSCRNSSPLDLNQLRFITNRTGGLITDCHRLILIQVR